ncbi:MAG: GNAT family N-acetyltransferase [Ardenticatenales bacterium]|nr:GNAT family N-acetyltransferase [Ardenticatenales bacterium]
MNIRSASPADIPAIAALVEFHARRAELLPRSVEAIRDTLADWVVGEQDNTVLGCASILQYTPWLGEIRSLAVNDCARRKGVGSGMVGALIDQARSRNIPTLFALTRIVPFFLGLGFAISDKTFFPEKIWRDCQLCLIQEHCDETAVVIHLAEVNHL